MNQNKLAQYIDLQLEIKELNETIYKLQKTKNSLEKGEIRDIVIGGYGGDQRFKISSKDDSDIAEKEYLINKNIRILRERQSMANELVLEVEQFINNIDDSRLRRIIDFKYVQGKTWTQTADAMKGNHTADSCRMDVKRYLRNINKK